MFRQVSIYLFTNLLNYYIKYCSPSSGDSGTRRINLTRQQTKLGRCPVLMRLPLGREFWYHSRYCHGFLYLWGVYMLQINLLDVAAVLLLAGFAIRGLMRGLVREVAGLVGIILAFALANQFQGKVQPSVVRFLGHSDWTGVVAYSIIFALVLAGVALFATALRKFMALTFTSWIDRLLGAVVGAAKGLLITTIVFYLLLRFVPNAPVVKGAQTAAFFTAMADYLRNFLPSTGTIHL